MIRREESSLPREMSPKSTNHYRIHGFVPAGIYLYVRTGLDLVVLVVFDSQFQLQKQEYTLSKICTDVRRRLFVSRAVVPVPILPHYSKLLPLHTGTCLLPSHSSAAADHKFRHHLLVTLTLLYECLDRWFFNLASYTSVSISQSALPISGYFD